MTTRLEFPLHASFKLLAFAPQFFVTDARGQSVAYVRQKLFKLKEAITVFSSEQQTQEVYRIAADRIIDFSPLYHFHTAEGVALGGIKRHGVRSMWRAGFEVLEDGLLLFRIQEKSVMTRFLDSLFSRLPVIGILSGYFFHPAYMVTRPDGTPVMELVKQPALFEGRFRADLLGSVSAREEEQLLLSLMTVVLLERARG